MQIRTKAILFFGAVILFFATIMVAYLELSVRKEFKIQVQNSIRVIAEQNELVYFGFIAKLEERTLDWSSDRHIKDIAERVINKNLSKRERKIAAEELGFYLKTSKLKYDKSVYAVDILDENGIVVASSRESRLGKDEGKEERNSGLHHFSKTINAKFGEVFTRDIIFEEEESPDPMFHVTTRMFSIKQDADGNFKPLSAVMLVHFTAIQDLQDQFSGNTNAQETLALASKQFDESFNTAETFLINSDHRNVLYAQSGTTTHIVNNIVVNTKPVEECFRNSSEVTGEYLNTKGVLVVGSSVCFAQSGIVLINEVSAKELYYTMDKLILNTIIWGLVILLVVVFLTYFASRHTMRRLFEVISASEKISQGDLMIQLNIDGEDEIGILSKSFNHMTSSLKDARSNLEKKVKERTSQLEKEKKISEGHVNELQKFKIAIENANDMITISDPDGKILFANPAAEKITGYALSEILGSTASLWGKQMPESFYNKLWKTLKIDKNKFTGEITNKRKSGEIYQVLADISPIVDEKNEVKFFVSLERDITKEKEIDKQKTEFVSLASHQLKTPLGSIGWATEALLNDDYGKLTKKAKDIIGDVARTNLRMRNLVEAFLNVSRIDLGTFIIETKEVDWKGICDEVLFEIVQKVKEKKIKITKNYDEKLKITKADPNLLRIIFQNFISNSVKYAPVGGNVYVSIVVKSRNIIISVGNNGEAIPKDGQSKIFSKLFRASDAQARDPDGNGLGLYLVKSIVENGGGKVWFESEDGKNTMFYASFPISGMKERKGNAKLV